MEDPKDTRVWTTRPQPKREALNLPVDPEDLFVIGLFIYTLKGLDLQT